MASPLIKRTEDLYELPQALSNLGYNSVLDVVRVPRERFVRQHRDTLGRRAGQMYDLAIGYAHQIVHQFRHNRVAGAVNRALSGPFSVAGPDYSNQFLKSNIGWKDRAPSGAPEANDGPVAYLAYIYGRVLQEEKDAASQYVNTLKERRPDIGTLLVNDAAINEEIPQIQLVNEVLASAIQSVQDLKALGDVNTLLAKTRYPNTLPYDHGNRQIRAAESALDVLLSDYLLPQDIALFQACWGPQTALNETQAKNLARVQVMASQLGPEQQTIVAEPPFFGSGTGGAASSFYRDNFGDAGLTAASFKSMEVLTSRLEVTVPDVETILCVTASGPSADFNKNAPTVLQSPNYITPATVPLPCLFGARFISAGQAGCVYVTKDATTGDSDGSLNVMALTDDRMDRINRMVRLQKWLGMPFEDIDLLVTSVMGAEGSSSNSALLMNDNTLRMLGVFQYYQSTYNVSAKQFAAWLYLLTPFSITPARAFFDQVFNNSDAFDAPLVVDGKDFDYTAQSGDDAARVKKICTALKLNRSQFLAFAGSIVRQQSGAGDTKLSCSLSNLSALYRMASLARTLNTSPEDFCALAELMDQGTDAVWRQLAGQPVVSIPKKDATLASDFLALLQALSVVSQWLQKIGLSARAALEITKLPDMTNVAKYGDNNTASVPSSLQNRMDNIGNQGTAYQFALVQEVWQHLPNTFVDSSLFTRSGAALVDDNLKPIDWKQLLSGDGKLLDNTGLVTDVADNTVSVPIDGAPTSIVKVLGDVVDAQALSNDEKARAKVSLNAAVIQARQTQTGVATSLLAKALDVGQSLSALLLRWIGLTPYQWLKATWALKVSVQSAVDIPRGYLDGLEAVARRALLCGQFSLSPAALQRLLEHPDQFGLPAPYSGDVALGTLYVLGRYDDLLHRVGGGGGGTEDDVLAYLSKVNGNSPPSASDAAELLGSLLGWEQEEVQAAWIALSGVAKNVPQLDAVMRLSQTQKDTGLTVSEQQQAFALDRDSGYDAWQAVGQAMVAAANHVAGVTDVALSQPA